jgi:hypothetical protein
MFLGPLLVCGGAVVAVVRTFGPAAYDDSPVDRLNAKIAAETDPRRRAALRALRDRDLEEL